MPKRKKLKGSNKKKFDKKIDKNIKTKKDVFDSILNYYKDSTINNKQYCTETLFRYTWLQIENNEILKEQNVVILYDDRSLSYLHADKIYKTLNQLTEDKPIILILVSNGGYSGPAYLIGKLFQQFVSPKFKNFRIVIPRRAKSAATLLSCSASEIHMGKLSELGPIDPQIDGMPTLGLKNSIEHIAELASLNEKSSNMFAKYLALTVKPISVGHYERIAESAVQYAERLLNKKINKLKNNPHKIAEKLVYGYKDHSFVIDQEEAKDIFGNKIIKENTKEYYFGDKIYQSLTEFKEVANILKINFSFVGDISKIDFINVNKK